MFELPILIVVGILTVLMFPVVIVVTFWAIAQLFWGDNY